MKLKSFKYLKESGACSGKSPLKENTGVAADNNNLKVKNGKVEKKKKNHEVFFEETGEQEKQENSIKVDSFDYDRAYFSPISVKDRKTFDPENSLMVTGFCYGCLRFSVEAPGTKNEMGWCKRRDRKTGKTIFKRILSDVLIRQCKIRKE